jgi:hypothetical protein
MQYIRLPTPALSYEEEDAMTTQVDLGERANHTLEPASHPRRPAFLAHPGLFPSSNPRKVSPLFCAMANYPGKENNKDDAEHKNWRQRLEKGRLAGIRKKPRNGLDKICKNDPDNARHYEHSYEA